MQTRIYDRKYYVGMWAEILTSYQWWGYDLITLLDNIEKTNPIVGEVFENLYSKDDEGYVPVKAKESTMFYQKLNSLIPFEEILNFKIQSKALNKKTEELAISDSGRMKRYDYLIAILCFVEEFAFSKLNDNNVSCTDDALIAHAECIDVFVERNKKTKTTLVRITIPCELCIEYHVSPNSIRE